MIGPRLTLADLHVAKDTYGGEIEADLTGTRLVGATMAGVSVTLGPVRVGGA